MDDSYQHGVEQKEVDLYKVSKPQKNQSVELDIREAVALGKTERVVIVKRPGVDFWSSRNNLLDLSSSMVLTLE